MGGGGSLSANWVLIFTSHWNECHSTRYSHFDVTTQCSHPPTMNRKYGYLVDRFSNTVIWTMYAIGAVGKNRWLFHNSRAVVWSAENDISSWWPNNDLHSYRRGAHAVCINPLWRQKLYTHFHMTAFICSWKCGSNLVFGVHAIAISMDMSNLLTAIVLKRG